MTSHRLRVDYLGGQQFTRAEESAMKVDRISTTEGRFPIERFARGRGPSRAGTETPVDGDGNAFHFRCYTPIQIGTVAVLLDENDVEMEITVTERFGDYYNVRATAGPASA